MAERFKNPTLLRQRFIQEKRLQAESPPADDVEPQEDDE